MCIVTKSAVNLVISVDCVLQLNSVKIILKQFGLFPYALHLYIYIYMTYNVTFYVNQNVIQLTPFFMAALQMLERNSPPSFFK